MVSYDYPEDRITCLEKDRKQMQTTLENLQYTMSVVESQINNNYNHHMKQIKEINQYLYCIIMCGLVILVVYICR